MNSHKTEERIALGRAANAPTIGILDGRRYQISAGIRAA